MVVPPNSNGRNLANYDIFDNKYGTYNGLLFFFFNFLDTVKKVVYTTFLTDAPL